MKNFTKLIALLLAVIMCVCLFAACEKDPPADDKVTVCWYEGSKLLKEEQVDKGAKLTSWTPTSEAGEFDGWFAEASKTTPFDFETVINEDTDIFAKFRSNEFVADTNSYYFIGTGAGDMGASAWDHAKSEAALTMAKADSADANVYSVKIKMYAGDMFQICYGGSWDGQMGIGYVDGAAYADGVNFYDNNTYTAADKKYAEVKNDKGEVVFIGADEYNKGFETWNVKLAEGMDGVYEFTFTTFPNAKEYNKITYKLVEKLEPMTETHKMQLVGTFNSWNQNDDSADYAMKQSDDGKTWSAIVTLEAGAEFKVVNQIPGAWFSPDGNNIVIAEAGTYAVKYTVEGDKVEFAKCEYYVVGTFADAEGKAVNFSVKDGVTPKLTVADTTASVTFTAVDVTAMGDFSWMKDQGKPGVCAIKVVLGSELGIATWYSDDANGGDNWYVTAGEHTVTLDIAAGTVTVN